MSNHIHNASDLHQAILALQLKQKEDFRQIKEESVNLLRGFNPGSIVKVMLSQLTATPDFKRDMLNTIIGLTAGSASRKVVTGNNPGRLMDLVGVVIELSVASVVTRNSDGVSALIINTISKWFTQVPEPEP
jgi:hypothetical protein